MRKKFFFLGILLGVCLASPAQFYSARTNLIGLATGNINLEGSMTLNRRWSLHLPVQYNPFVFKDNRQFRNLTVMPGVRYWFVESYSNFFVGMNTLASGYSIGRIWNKKRYEGEGYGIGLVAIEQGFCAGAGEALIGDVDAAESLFQCRAEAWFILRFARKQKGDATLAQFAG